MTNTPQPAGTTANDNQANGGAEKKEDYSTMPSGTLRSLRDSFVAALQPMQNKIEELDAQISAAEYREYQEKCAAAMHALVPGGDKALLDDRRIVFLINNSKEGTKDAKSTFLNNAVGAAFTTATRVAYAGADRKMVNASFWGIYGDLRLDPRFGGTDFNANDKELHNFLPAAKKVLDMSTPDIVAGKTQNFVVICEGTLADDIAPSVAILAAAARLNPAATFDFVVCNAAETAMDKLVQAFSETEDGKNVNLIKIAAPEEISAAVVAALKARMEGKVHTPPAPQLPVKQPEASAAEAPQAAEEQANQPPQAPKKPAAGPAL
ncbi:MAG: hypothetical protein KGL10_02970 [Alphaproteobacteria bacterium]|nr:hypothetical protein [Alphaproteobacteria bacterium]